MISEKFDLEKKSHLETKEQKNITVRDKESNFLKSDFRRNIIQFTVSNYKVF